MSAHGQARNVPRLCKTREAAVYHLDRAVVALGKRYGGKG